MSVRARAVADIGAFVPLVPLYRAKIMSCPSSGAPLAKPLIVQDKAAKRCEASLMIQGIANKLQAKGKVDYLRISIF